MTLNRPQALNVYNIQMRDDLYQVLGAIKDDPEVRVVIFRGAGEKAFCAGADLSEFLSAPSPIIARQARFGRDVWSLFLSIPQPLIAAVHGYVLGSGIEIALCCDIRIASEDAKFGLPEVGLGILPAAGGTQTLPRAIGMARALEMLLANRRLSSEEAYATGLVNQVVPKNKLLETAEEMAKKIASLPSDGCERMRNKLSSGDWISVFQKGWSWKEGLRWGFEGVRRSRGRDEHYGFFKHCQCDLS